MNHVILSTGINCDFENRLFPDFALSEPDPKSSDYDGVEYILFTIGENEFPLEIIDKDNQRWVTRRQLGNSLGFSDLRELHSQLVKKEELKEGTHFTTITVMYPDGNTGRGNPARVIYSYRGIIRISMHCEGKHAKQFRDWAEDVLYEVMITGSYSSEEKRFSETNNFNSLCLMAEDDAALERMLRTRRKALTEIGFDEITATFKAVESIRKDTGIDVSARFGFRLDELKRSEPAGELHKDASANKKMGCGELHKKEDISSESDIPGTYRGWNLNRRGENRKGESVFNLTRKIGGKKRQKYLGVWNQEKADQIIDEMNDILVKG